MRAVFEHPQTQIGSVTLNTGDIFTEWYYTCRWYNVFLIQDRLSEEIKGWYCNFTRPAVIKKNTVCAEDLELDLVITPNRCIQLLDLREYLTLGLKKSERQAIAAAYRQICALVETRGGPFRAAS